MVSTTEVDRKEGLEKDYGSTHEVDVANDPDAGLTPEEKAAHVRSTSIHHKCPGR